MLLDAELVRMLGLTEAAIERIAADVRAELERRGQRYRGAHPAVSVRGRPVVVVDDGLATGATMEAAVQSARARGAARVVAAAPVSSSEAETRLRAVSDGFVCLVVDPMFTGVGAYYEQFPQLTDEEVVRLLAATRAPPEG